VEKETNMSGDDYEFSSSDASVNEESSETEGSSGEEESDIETEDNDDNFDDSSLIFSRKGKATIFDSQELKQSRKVTSSYLETFQREKFYKSSLKWTKN
jgi:hypothetical protein